MRRFNLFLLAALRFCSAKNHQGFSIHRDLLAFPQFEVVFTDTFVSEKEAHRLLDSSTHPSLPPTASSDPSAGNDNDPSPDGGRDSSTDNTRRHTSQTYEIMNMAPHQYLCNIPMVQPPPPENQTATELARQEEVRELGRATESGWELLNQLDDTCLYFMSGWWSYSFCNNREMVQYHALPSMPNGQPPRRDPRTAEYVLGRVPAIPSTEVNAVRRRDEGRSPLPADIQVKGDQRFLVQKLEGGTICDLTGRDRTIEVQYHCVPGMKDDRIGWIKEVTICSYLMVVNTPRLCKDVAFLPPEETKANPITCQLIVGDKEQDSPRLIDQMKAKLPLRGGESSGSGSGIATPALADGSPPEAQRGSQPVTIGGIVVGARQILSGADEVGKPPTKLSPPKDYLGKNKGKGGKKDAERVVDLVAQAASKEDGGKVEVLSKEELEKLDINPDVIREMREEMKKLAGDAGWKLEIVEMDAGQVRELRGYVDGEEDDVDGDEAAGDGAPRGQETVLGRGKKTPKTKGRERDNAGDDDVGSEEVLYRKDEL